MARFVRTAQITNYKSIARCRVDLNDLMLLVGPNGAGKSNFLDALRFVSDALNTTLEQALRDRGGIQSVRRRSRGHPTHFGIRLDLNLLDNRSASYAFKIAAQQKGTFSVQREACRITPGLNGLADYFVVEEGRVTDASSAIPTAVEADRLGLVAISGLPEFRPVYDALRRMGFYNLNPERIRDLQEPDPGQLLARDGRNLAAVIRELGRFESGRVLEQASEHLQAVVPGVVGVAHRPLGPKETIEFRQEVTGDPNPWRFMAAEMSDGTLRALGILVAAFQANMNGQRRVSLVGIEEPEVALHPGAAEIIAEVMLLASQTVQVLATTHSPDLLNHKAIRDEHLLAVSVEGGETVIGPVDKDVRSMLRDKLYSAGELLSQAPITPDMEVVAENSRQLRLFEQGEE